jgi:hypothetical protein
VKEIASEQDSKDLKDLGTLLRQKLFAIITTVPIVAAESMLYWDSLSKVAVLTV